jgi:3-phenylpropionate/cinnamic acid dioxygenase small subunit
MKPKVSIEDRIEVQDLIARYAWALDVGDVEGYLDCFTEDGWIEHHPPGRCEGREAIRQLTNFLWYEHPNNYLGRQHRMSQTRMFPEGPDVRVKAFWSILQHDVFTQENFVFGLGTWDALAVRDTDGEWRLKTLFVDIWRGSNVPWVGDSRAWTKRAQPVEA